MPRHASWGYSVLEGGFGQLHQLQRPPSDRRRRDAGARRRDRMLKPATSASSGEVLLTPTTSWQSNESRRYVGHCERILP